MFKKLLSVAVLIATCSGAAAQGVGQLGPNQFWGNLSASQSPSRPTSLGTSIANPGTGVPEAILPVQTVAGASKAFATADLFKKTRRTNSGSAMTDALPAAGTTGLINGTRVNIVNTDATATDTVTAGAGTTIGSASSYLISPGRDIIGFTTPPIRRGGRMPIHQAQCFSAARPRRAISPVPVANSI